MTGVSGWIDDRSAVGFEVRIPAFREFGRGTGGVAGIAMVQDVHVVAGKSHERGILARHIQRDRGDLETDANPGLLAVLSLRPCDSTHGSHGKQRGKRGRCCPGDA